MNRLVKFVEHEWKNAREPENVELALPDTKNNDSTKGELSIHEFIPAPEDFVIERIADDHAPLYDD